MIDIEKIISPLVKTQFPEFYVSEGERFIDFVRQYYVWMESQNKATNRSRSLFDYKDIDKTSSEFIAHYKNKYLEGFSLNTEANTQLLVKHSKDIYSTKGTHKGIEISMRALFNQDVELYFPSSDLFKTSDGVWVKPIYLEVTSNFPKTKTFIGKQIVGNKTGAIAFVESIITKRIEGRFVEILYLSQLQGTFETGEYITTTTNLVLDGCPRILGSLSSLTVVQGGAYFNIGDIFNITTGTGKNAKARVSAVSNQTGKVSFIFVDAFTSGGWGYSLLNSNVAIAQKMLQVSNTTNANAAITNFELFEGLTQQFANIAYNTARPNNASYEVGAVIENYHANGDVSANATIVATNKSNTTAGYVIVAPNYGNVVVSDSVFAIKGTGESATFNANSGVANATEYITTISSHPFVNNDVVIYSTRTGNTSLVALSTGAAYCVVGANSTALQLSNTQGGTPINLTAGLNETGHVLTKSLGSGVITVYADRTATGTVVGANSQYVGVVNISSNGFLVTPYSKIIGSISNTVAIVANTSTGTGATFQISLLTDTESVFLTPDFLHSNNTQNVQFSTINLNGNNSGLIHTGVPHVINGGVQYLFNANSGVANTTEIITTITPHTFSNNDLVRYSVSSSNTAIGGLTSNGTYYVINAVSGGTTLRLSTTVGGAAINVTAGLNETGHALSKGDLCYGGLGFVKYPNSSVDSTLLDCLRFENDTIGSIAAISGLSPGDDYNVDPFVVVINPFTSGYLKHDYNMIVSSVAGAFVEREQILQTFSNPATQLTISNFSGTAANGSPTTTVITSEKIYQLYANGATRAQGFVVESGISAGSGTIKLTNVTGTFVNTSNGSTLMQSFSSGGTANISLVTTVTLATTARAIVKQVANTTYLKLKRINLENTFQVGGTIIGQVSGATATIDDIAEDTSQPVIGLNSTITANVQTANNVATKLDVYDSGFGYIDYETVTLSKENSNYTITAIVRLGKEGHGAGFFQTTKGFLDSNKKLHDNDYYQEYSYEVISKIPFDRYMDVLKKVTHVAGTKMFGKLSVLTSSNLQMSAINSITLS